MTDKQQNLCRLAALLLMATSLSGCNTWSRLTSIGKEPELAPIQNPVDAPGYQAGTGDCALQLMSEGAMSKLEFARHCAFLQEVVLDCTAGGAKPLCIWKE